MSITIFGTTGYENEPGYHEILDKPESVIRTQTKNSTGWIKKNIQIGLDFSYNDLHTIVDNVMTGEGGKSFRISLGFGYMLYHTVNEVFRYYYVSTNLFLFNRAFTISTHTDMTMVLK